MNKIIEFWFNLNPIKFSNETFSKLITTLKYQKFNLEN